METPDAGYPVEDSAMSSRIREVSHVSGEETTTFRNPHSYTKEENAMYEFCIYTPGEEDYWGQFSSYKELMDYLNVAVPGLQYDPKNSNEYRSRYTAGDVLVIVTEPQRPDVRGWLKNNGFASFTCVHHNFESYENDLLNHGGTRVEIVGDVASVWCPAKRFNLMAVETNKIPEIVGELI